MQPLSRLAGSFKLILCSLGLLLIQMHFVARLPYQALRIDLLLLLILGCALQVPFIFGIHYALLMGFIMDVFSGKFWGFHVGSYVITVILVNKVLAKFEVTSSVYQMLLAGLSAAGQSAALAMVLMWTQDSLMLSWADWANLVVRSLLMMFLAPLVIHTLSGIWES